MPAVGFSAPPLCSLENRTRVTSAGLSLDCSSSDGQVSELRSAGVCLCDFFFFGLLLKHEGRVFSDGVIQPGFVSPGMHFLVFVRGEPGVCVWGGGCLLFLWLEDFIVVLAISFFSLCARNGFLFVCFFLFLLLFLHMVIWWVLV